MNLWLAVAALAYAIPPLPSIAGLVRSSWRNIVRRPASGTAILIAFTALMMLWPIGVAWQISAGRRR